jgi:hypothetical protein
MLTGSNSWATRHHLEARAVLPRLWPAGTERDQPERGEDREAQPEASPCLVRAVRDALGRSKPILHPPPAAVAALSHALGVVVRDVVLTSDEIRGLTPGCWSRTSLRSGESRSSNGLKENASTLGRAYANELDRHFRVRG